MKTLTEKELLVVELCSGLENCIIAADGFDRVGKTTLSLAIAAAMKAEVVSIDEYLSAGGKSYLDSLRYNELKEHLEGVAASGNVIIEGLFVSAVLERLGEKPTQNVYVKCMTKHDDVSKWIHEGVLELGKNKEALLEAVQNVQPVNGLYLNYLHPDVTNYHLEYLPHQKANFILENHLPEFFG